MYLEQPFIYLEITSKVGFNFRTLKCGKNKLWLHKGMEADGSINTKTPSKLPQPDKVDELEKQIKQYERGELPHIPWLDGLTFMQLEKRKQEELLKSKFDFMFIELPNFDFTVLFHEQVHVVLIGRNM